MAEHHGRVVPSFNLRNFFYGFLSGPVPTLEALRTSTKSGSGASPSSEAGANRPELLPARRTWIAALLIWAVACIFHLGFFALAYAQHRRHPTPETPLDIDFPGYLNVWDATFYSRIYANWYPHELPIRTNGSVDFNNWAFYPLQPLLGGGISNIFGIRFPIASLVVSLLAGFVLAVVLYRLFIGSLNWRARGVFDTRALVGDESRSRLALWGLAVYALSPASPIFVTGYAEALSTLLLALSVWCVLRGRYVLLLPVALLAALSRPVGVPLGAFVGLWWLWCTVNDYRLRRIEDASHSALSDAWAAFRGRFGHLLGALLVCSFAFAHPLYAALYTGRHDACLTTELGWSNRKPSYGHQYFVLWVDQIHRDLSGAVPKVVLALLFAALIVGFYWRISSKLSRTLIHPAMWLWTASYAGYLFVFWLPISSTVRILLPLFPLSLLVASYLPKSRWYRPALVVLSVLMSAGWVIVLWGNMLITRHIVLVP